MALNLRISDRLNQVQPSATLAVSAAAKKLRAQGVDVVSFGPGEPDFDTPEHIKEAARQGLVDGVAKYTVVPGIPPLRQAVADEMSKVHGMSLSPDQVVVTNGAKQSLFNIFMTLLNPGDEIIIPSPYWVSYTEMVKLAGGTPVVVPTTEGAGFMLSADALEAAITPRTRALLINTPSNPTGAIYSREVLQALGRVCVERDLLIITDDIYRSLVYGDASYTSIASLGDDIAERCILVDGVSKTYAMTGWRIGWTAGPVELIKSMTKLQGQSTGNASHIAQVAATAALTGPQNCVEEMRQTFEKRRALIVERLRAIDGVDIRMPEGAFYAFPNLSHFIGMSTTGGDTISNDLELCSYLVEDARVAVVPGSGFGAPGFIRMSYACSEEDIDKGTARLAEALGTLTS